MEPALSFTPVQFIPEEQIIAGSLILNLEKIEQTWNTNKVNQKQAKEIKTTLAILKQDYGNAFSSNNVIIVKPKKSHLDQQENEKIQITNCLEKLASLPSLQSEYRFKDPEKTNELIRVISNLAYLINQ